MQLIIRDLIYRSPHIIIKMREDNIPVEKIAYYTGIPKEIIVSI